MVVGEAGDTTVSVQIGFWHLPGPTVTATSLSSFQVARHGNRAVVRWEVAWVSPGGGFQVWRQESGEPRVQLTRQPLQGQVRYEFVDATVPAEEVDYWLRDAREEGAWYGPARLPAAPLVFGLAPNHPNPFNPQTVLRYSLPDPSPVRLSLHDVQGRLVRILVDDRQPAGLYTVTWDGRDGRGRGVAAGVYFVRLEASFGVATRKMVLAR
jgi:hypothetical protein